MKNITLTKNKLIAEINKNLPAFTIFAVLSLTILSYQLLFWQSNYITHVSNICKIENYNLYSVAILLLLDVEVYFITKFPNSKTNILRHISKIVQIPSIVLVSIYAATIFSLMNEIFNNGISGLSYATFYITFMGLISILFQTAIVYVNSLINRHNKDIHYGFQPY